MDAHDWARYPVGRVGLAGGEMVPGGIGGRADSQWVKAAGGLADGIRTGRYASGERLPTVEDMALAACVHPRVMARALRRLRELGYVCYRKGYGYYVSPNPPSGAI